MNNDVETWTAPDLPGEAPPRWTGKQRSYSVLGSGGVDETGVEVDEFDLDEGDILTVYYWGLLVRVQIVGPKQDLIVDRDDDLSIEFQEAIIAEEGGQYATFVKFRGGSVEMCAAIQRDEDKVIENE